MSRLSHSELYLTFRDWSSSESEQPDHPSNSESGTDTETDRHSNTPDDNMAGSASTNSGARQEGTGPGEESDDIDNGNSSLSHDMVDVSLHTDSILGNGNPVLQRPRSLSPIELLNNEPNLDDLDKLLRSSSYLANGLSGANMYGPSFFKNHVDHEFVYGIPGQMQRYGLNTLMNDLLIHRNNQVHTKSKDPNGSGERRKRSFNQVCLDDNHLEFLNQDLVDPLKVKTLAYSSFLKSGSTFSLPTILNGIRPNLKFTDVNYQNLNVAGHFQFGDTTLSFSGELVDFLKNDLRYSKDKRFLIEGNVFSNLLRNKLVLNRRFQRYFDKDTQKCYTKSNWKPFSMNRMGYIISNKNKYKLNNTRADSTKGDVPHIHENKNKQRLNKKNRVLFHTKTEIKPTQNLKFPNGSIFHKLQISNDYKFDTYKVLSKWFELPPLNQFINTPAPPTPPNRLNKCTNNPENLLVCKDCVNLIMSKFLFLKLEIDIHDLFDDPKKKQKELKVYPDLLYKHRRRFHFYTKKLMSRSSSRNYVSRQLANISYTIDGGIRVYDTVRIRRPFNLAYDSDENDLEDNGAEGFDRALETLVRQNNINNSARSNYNSDYSNENDDSDIINNNNADYVDDVDDDDEDVGLESENVSNQILLSDNDLNFDSSITDTNLSSDAEVDHEVEAYDNIIFNSNTSSSDNESTNENEAGDTFRNESDDSREFNSNDNMFSVWPVSAERFGESHPILDPDILSNDGEGDNSDDDFENPYNFAFTNDRTGRVSRFLFNINMGSEQYRHKKEPVSSLNLYKSGQQRLKLILLATINRSSGELNIIPGNMDVNLWSNEQCNGELFEDVETLSKVFNIFMNSSELSKGDTSYTRKIKQWIHSKRRIEADEIKRLFVLHLLTNPSIVSGYENRKAGLCKLTNNLKSRGKSSKHNKMKKPKKKNKLKTKVNGRKINTEKHIHLQPQNTSEHLVNEELREQLMNFVGNSANFEVDKEKVLTFKPGLENRDKTEKQGLNFSFAYV